jgi:hypothetical protein
LQVEYKKIEKNMLGGQGGFLAKSCCFCSELLFWFGAWLLLQVQLNGAEIVE